MRTLDGVRPAPLVEQHVLEALDGVVELLDRLEVPVDDGVEQPVHERADAELEQLAGRRSIGRATWRMSKSSLPRTVMIPRGRTKAEIRVVRRRDSRPEEVDVP